MVYICLFFKQKTAYEMRISDWSSDVCSSDLDYYYQSRLGNRLFDLDLGPAALAFAGASTPQDQRDIDRVLTQAGAPGFAGAWLRHRGLDWAADLLPSSPAASFLASQPLEVSP